MKKQRNKYRPYQQGGTKTLQPWEVMNDIGSKEIPDVKKLPFADSKLFKDDVSWMSNFISQRGEQAQQLSKDYAAAHKNDLSWTDKGWLRQKFFPENPAVKANERVSEAINNVNTVKFYNTSVIDNDTMVPLVQGEYYPDKHSIYINKFKSSDKELKAHEIGHSSGLQNWAPAYEYIDKLKSADTKFQSQPKDSYNNYRTHSSEIYSRIWGLRRTLGLKPEDVVTPEFLKAKRDAGLLGGQELDEFLTDETIIKLLNNLVQNKSTNRNENIFAQKGGTINDSISKYGYRYDSPYKSNPFLDIQTPEGLIDMSQTPIDLLGIDNLGNTKKMKAGRKNPYKFAGSVVREIPMQQGGWMPNPGNKGMLGEGTLEDALRAADKLKIRRSGNFKALIPIEEWNDDVMNYIDKFKIVNRKGKDYIKARGELPPTLHPPVLQLPPDERELQQGGMPRFPMTGLVNTVRTKYTLEGPQEVMEQRLPELPFQPLPLSSPQKTNFSITYPDARGQQMTKYYPTLEEWQKKMETTPYISQQIAGDKSSASASGYLNPYQQGGITQEMFNEMFGDDEDEEEDVIVQEQGVKENDELALDKTMRMIKQAEADELALEQAAFGMDNPYRSRVSYENFEDEFALPEGYDMSTYTGQLKASTGTRAGFRSFATPEQGWNALRNQLNLYKTGRTRNPVGPNSTLLQAMSVYAPAADRNNPVAYANTIAQRLGISVNTKIADIDTDRWAKEIARVEGNKVGNNPGNLRPTK